MICPVCKSDDLETDESLFISMDKETGKETKRNSREYLCNECGCQFRGVHTSRSVKIYYNPLKDRL